MKPYVHSMMNGLGGEYNSPYEMLWRRVPVLYNEIVAASTCDLKVSKAGGEYPLAFGS